MSQEKKRLTVSANHAAAVEFQTPAQAEVMSNQELVQRILQCAACVVFGQAVTVQDDAGMAKIPIHQQPLVGPEPEVPGRKVKEKTVANLVHAPQTSRVMKMDYH